MCCIVIVLSGIINQTHADKNSILLSYIEYEIIVANIITRMVLIVKAVGATTLPV